MCGIGGYFGDGDERTLLSINKILAHRGPDSSGVWEGTGIGLAHRRLAIIDLSAKAAQPMHRGVLTLIFNGEIYNYRELRTELEKRGSVFTTQSDTEVILALFERGGAEAFARLEGMFALALYDGAHDTLYLARDRFGEKPLYWLRTGDTLMFASEANALFVQGSVSRAIRPEGLAAYLSHDVAASPLSLFEGVSQVPPATYLTCTRHLVKETRYWHPSFIEQEVMEVDALRALDSLLESSVKRQLISDVPLGIFLSGGIDSSLIASYAKKLAGEVHTFSIGFEEKSYDESSCARAVAKHLGTTHHEHILSSKDIEHTLISITSRMDEPIADPAILPLHLLSSFARERITVALSGDGSDELFLGYPTFFAERFLSYYRRTPKALRALVAQGASLLPISHRYMSFDFKLRQFLRGADEVPAQVHHAWLAAFSPEEITAVLAPRYREAVSDLSKRDKNVYEEAREGEPLTRASWWYVRTLLELYLMKADRASMYASLETRAPFLDRSVAEYALTLPTNLKLRGRQGKYILRRLAEEKLPAEVAWRKKHGFGLPIGQWLREEWRALLTDALSPANVENAGLCDPRIVSRYVEEHLGGTRNHAKKLYSLLILHMWHANQIQK